MVGNDACWSQISREQVPILGSNVACGLAFTGRSSEQPGGCLAAADRQMHGWIDGSMHLIPNEENGTDIYNAAVAKTLNNSLYNSQLKRTSKETVSQTVQRQR